MAYRGGRRRRRGEGSRVRPQGQPGLTGETGLVVAFLQLVMDDLMSDHATLRTEAWQFLEDRMAVRFWCSLVNLDDTAFLERTAQLERAKGPG
jgi:hypothetical protein